MRFDYDEEIDARIKKVASRWKGTSYKKMFGGVCHLLNGNMVGGVHKDKLIFRLGEKESGKALQKEHVIPFDITGKPMKGWIMVEKEGFKTDEELRALLNLTKTFAKTLPPK